MSERERARRGGGVIRERAPGSWQVTLSTTDPDTGRRKRSSQAAGSYREARAALAEMQRRVSASQPVRDSAMTFAEWAERWKADVLPASNRRESSCELYRRHLGTHLLPALGKIRLDRLRASDIDRLVVAMRAKGRKPATVRSVFNVLSAVLGDAVRDGLLAANPLERVTRPSVPRSEAKHLERADVGAVITAARETRLYPVVLLLAATGLRRGEALALRWVDVDLDAGVAQVTGTLYRTKAEGLVRSDPKTEKSRRPVHLTAPVVAALRQRRRDQAAEQLAVGPAWTNVSGLVFTTEVGTPLEPRNVARMYQAAAKRAGVGGSLHTLRHSAATAMLANGVDHNSAADALGHSSPAITLAIYGHSDAARQRAAAEVVTAALGLG